MLEHAVVMVACVVPTASTWNELIVLVAGFSEQSSLIHSHPDESSVEHVLELVARVTSARGLPLHLLVCTLRAQIANKLLLIDPDHVIRATGGDGRGIGIEVSRVDSHLDRLHFVRMALVVIAWLVHFLPDMSST